jgi:hypothetical protein
VLINILVVEYELKRNSLNQGSNQTEIIPAYSLPKKKGGEGGSNNNSSSRIMHN